MSVTLPEVVAVIPARGGSKGVPGKNIAPVGGVPLIGRAIRAAFAAGNVDRVYVSTDDAVIGAAARAHGAEVIDRPAALASDTASSEDALLHALDVIAAGGAEPKVMVFMQATSPFIDPSAIRDAVARVRAGEEDVVFSAFETYAFLWRRADAGAEGVNHDHSFRPRRQDREPHYQETGAFYVIDVAGFRASRYRFFGRVGIAEVDAATAVEIDEPRELELSRALAPLVDTAEPIAAAALVMDFDGVHTEDLVTVDQDGKESVTVSRSDGMGIGRLRAAGVPMLILSKERNPVVSARGAKLGVEVRQGIDDKVEVLRDWCAANGLDLADVAFVGNDVNDAGCLELVGWPVVVPDAHPAVVGLARVRLSAPGGRGALRELADRMLAARRDHGSPR
ncbi:acylneuraminate cytidylyltransferase [Demequina maris]|uniref:acylneuraminate cytidylyltransferase n=1 Tax=Demequina maris TaxID=1638982 RepID=UPI0007823B0A|nr:acylneuraminate cytidylyltransferase [Demequina maris]